MMINSYLCVISILLAIAKSASACYTSIFSFGDSLSDNGNLLGFSSPKVIHQGRLPNGETYFGRPTGRCCDGRLIVDLIAQNFGLPIPPPFVGIEKGNRRDILAGVNFAVAGAKALDSSFYEEKRISEAVTNATLRVQLRWFKEVLPFLCGPKANCKEFLQSSLTVMGEIGGNDYNHALLQGISKEEVKTFVPSVVGAISSAITDIIQLGALNLIVPGNLPFGCSAAYLTYYYKTSRPDDYDEDTGCINWLNDLSKHHNEVLQIELNGIRELYPHATIIYADYYNSAMRLYRSPKEFGFARALSACCGAGGPYNYNASVGCGDSLSTGCDDPSLYICWDGLHLTEAANKWIVQSLFEGSYSTPPINMICNFVSTGIGHSYQD
ncbi:hypothetical protein ACH5RR_015271 [Cinchona calisaya]|uniref:GDSL esterase/lipase n=1 Tax=Cinchona calisaya TaxID=153742 RepID=A0ABD2ZW79_9GENT